MSISFVIPSTNDNLVVTRLNCSQHPSEPKHAKIGHRNRDPKGHPKKQEWLSIYKGTTNDLTLHAKLLPQKPKQHEKPRQTREEGRMRFQSQRNKKTSKTIQYEKEEEKLCCFSDVLMAQDKARSFYPFWSCWVQPDSGSVTFLGSISTRIRKSSRH